MNENIHIKASIITIGDELLIGQTIDTNSAWMASSLNNIGISIQRRVAVGDEWHAIWEALEEEENEESKANDNWKNDEIKTTRTWKNPRKQKWLKGDETRKRV